MSSNRRVAVVVGVDGYQNAPVLRGCVNDSTEMASCLTFEQYGFDVSTLANKEATRANILERLGELAYGSAGGEMLLFFFAGHGTVVGNSGHLVCHDATPFDPGISLTQLSDLMESASQFFTHVVTILDCCHAGSAKIWNNSRPLIAADIEREMRVVNSSRSILGACTAEGTAKESADSPRGIFTEALVQGLLGDAVNFEGAVTLLALHEYVSRAIDPAVQVPVFKGDLTGTVVIGEGFEPRRGAQIDSEEKRHVLARAQSLMDSHYQMQIRELADRDQRINGGSRRCAVELEDIVRWFEETQASLPDLMRDTNWCRLQESVVDAQRRLSEVVEDEEIGVGKLLHRIGQGGFGQVWEVEGIDKKSLALKVFHGGELLDQVKVARFRNGFQNMRKLEHPNIVSVYSMTLAPLAFVMEYVPGPDLRDFYIDRTEVEPVVKMIIDITETLVHAHNNKVRHRDIKPENIIIVTDEFGVITPHLTDFDLAYHETNRTVTTNLGVGGVINYAAPEQLYEPNAATARDVTVDVYSLAQLMYFVLVGRDPSGENQHRNIEELTRSLGDWTDERAARVIIDLYTASTNRKPALRPSAMEDVLFQLSRAIGYIQETSGTDKILARNFCQRIAYMYAGYGGSQSDPDNEVVTMQSKSGQIGIALRTRGTPTDKVCDMELRLAAEQRLALPAISSSASARVALNHRMDKVTQRFSKATRRNGKKGQYEVFIDLKSVPLTVEGAAKIRELISESVSAIER